MLIALVSLILFALMMIIQADGQAKRIRELQAKTTRLEAECKQQETARLFDRIHALEAELKAKTAPKKPALPDPAILKRRVMDAASEAAGSAAFAAAARAFDEAMGGT